MEKCCLCPRNCGADRENKLGYCKAPNGVKIARAALHYWEEPSISGENGSGAVFFSHCNLGCVFCQNYKISQEGFGKAISVNRLADIFLELANKGAVNINLVSPTPYVREIVKALDMCKGKLNIPIVYNCGGYEKAETIDMLDGYVDVYLPDLKYISSEYSKKYSNAKDYFEYCAKALDKMFKQVGKIKIENGLLKTGMIIRHLVLPTMKNESVRVLEYIKDTFGTDNVLVSLMSQYTPFYMAEKYKEINRRLTTYEYNFVVNKAVDMGILGYIQDKSSAKEEYTPDFDLTGI